MIPLNHIQGEKYLVPFCRLHASTTGPSFVGFPAEGQRLILKPVIGTEEEEWKLSLVDEKNCWWELTTLTVKRSLYEGDKFLEGKFGMCCLIVKWNPKGLPDLTAYWAIKTPVPWCPSACKFLEDVA